MFTISNNGFVTLTRGDSFRAPLFINWGTDEVPVRFAILEHPKATVYVGVMECNQRFENALIRKYYTSNSKSDVNENGDIVVNIKSTDTEYLLPGKYYYEVKVDLGDGNVDTVIPKTEFFVLE